MSYLYKLKLFSEESTTNKWFITFPQNPNSKDLNFLFNNGSYFETFYYTETVWALSTSFKDLVISIEPVSHSQVRWREEDESLHFISLRQLKYGSS